MPSFLCAAYRDGRYITGQSVSRVFGRIELIIIDEAERLTNTALEYLHDRFDRSDIGLILIGMPGIEMRLE